MNAKRAAENGTPPRGDMAHIAPDRCLCWSVLEIRDARLNRRRWG